MSYTLKIARTDGTFSAFRFSSLQAASAARLMLRAAGTVRHAWIYERQALRHRVLIYSH